MDFVARFRSAPLPVLTARQLSNLTINYSSGSLPHWYSAPEGHTQDWLPHKAPTPKCLRVAPALATLCVRFSGTGGVIDALGNRIFHIDLPFRRAHAGIGGGGFRLKVTRKYFAVTAGNEIVCSGEFPPLSLATNR